MSEHAVLAPSAAPRWVPCPGSVALGALFPETEETEASREGTAAHWALEEALAGRMIATGQIAPNKWILDDDMVDGAEMFMNIIPARLRPTLLVESKVTMFKRIHPANWGTPDAWAYDPAKHAIYLWDYKFGRGVIDVFENLQLLDYLAGIMERLGINTIDDQNTNVVMCIVQPRAYHRDGHVRYWRIKLSDARGYWNRLQMSAAVAMGDDPPLNPGDHCDHCPANHACPALHNQASRIATKFETAAPLVLPDNALGFELREMYRLERILKARRTGLEADVEARLRKGHRIPWFALESAPGREHWTQPDASVVQLCALAGLDVAKPVKAITPRQAALGVAEAMVASISKREQTAQKVTLVTNDAVRRVFTIDNSINND